MSISLKLLYYFLLLFNYSFLTPSLYNDITEGNARKFGIDFMKLVVNLIKTGVTASGTNGPNSYTKDLYRFVYLIVSFQ